MRADSVTNEVWLTAGYAIRVKRDASLRLHREAVLSQVLPDEVGYPAVVVHGGEVGSDWLILRREPGMPLSRAWPAMALGDRREAVRQVAARLRAVHRTRCPRLDGLHDVPHLLDPAAHGAQATHRLREALRRAARLDHVDAGLMADASAMVEDTSDALDPFDAATIVHGDLTFENILWDGHQITALLDFGYARPGPPTSTSTCCCVSWPCPTSTWPPITRA
ncbi:MAG: phosphotransferase family protein [Acidimicrobiales bacterium]